MNKFVYDVIDFITYTYIVKIISNNEHTLVYLKNNSMTIKLTTI